ncbi:PD-(D/E)XK nuclease family protein [Acinetobacter sp. UBA3106]|uniref:PD-(D/E)XK nuclease family protein n=1 Tax=Acinetobacter sp. UBA3106 TaxID=1945936 RepID=UPI0025C3DCDF|nr:PD-(D/E)XK nuclease family protein [Acinetobacter sp. UBA3106]
MKIDILDQNLSKQLGNFVNQSQSINESKLASVQERSFTSQLEHFFQSWKNLSFEALEPEKIISLDSIGLSEFFECFKSAIEPMKQAKANGLLLNVWKSAGLSTDEVRNSKVLKWFLDCRGDHGQGNAILLQLLQLLPPRFHEYYPKFYSAVAECCPLGNLENRVDIEIDAPEFLLFIEVKIYANEGADQLKRYYRDALLKTKNLKKDWAIIYLTKTGYLSSTEDEIKGKLLLDHEDITNVIHDPLDKYETKRLIPMSWLKISKLFDQYSKQADVNNRGAWLAKQFADHIKTF